MTSPRHLWSGDWRADSATAAEELARRRATAKTDQRDTAASPPAAAPERPRGRQPTPVAAPPEPSAGIGAQRQPRTPRPPSSPPRPRQTAPSSRTPRPRVRRPGPRHVRVALLIALFALIVAGAAYGLSGLVGSSHGGAAQGEAWLGLEVVAPPVGGGLVAIAQVEPGSPAERAGLRPGDVITEIGGVPVTNPDDVHALIQGRRPGHQVEVGIQRGGVRIVQQITLAPRP